jgi:hypothetical protein
MGTIVGATKKKKDDVGANICRKEALRSLIGAQTKAKSPI